MNLFREVHSFYSHRIKETTECEKSMSRFSLGSKRKASRGPRDPSRGASGCDAAPLCARRRHCYGYRPKCLPLRYTKKGQGASPQMVTSLEYTLTSCGGCTARVSLRCGSRSGVEEVLCNSELCRSARNRGVGASPSLPKSCFPFLWFP